MTRDLFLKVLSHGIGIPCRINCRNFRYLVLSLICLNLVKPKMDVSLTHICICICIFFESEFGSIQRKKIVG